MKLIGCDRCRTVFPRDAQHTVVWLFDTVGDEMDLHVPEPSDSRELCPSCRADLDAFLAGTPDDAARTDAGPAVKTKRKSPTWSKEHTCEICGAVEHAGCLYLVGSGWKNTTESARRRADAVIAEAEALLDG